MEPTIEKDKAVQEYLQEKKIARLEELKAILKTDTRMTVFRSLRRLGSPAVTRIGVSFIRFLSRIGRNHVYMSAESGIQRQQRLMHSGIF